MINAIETGWCDPSLPLAFAVTRYFHPTTQRRRLPLSMPHMVLVGVVVVGAIVPAAVQS